MTQATMKPEQAADAASTILEAPPAPTPSRALKVESFGMTDPGKTRASNEDQFLIAEMAKVLQIRQTSLPPSKKKLGHERGYLFLVADGMGGHAAGEQASALAIDSVEAFMLDRFKWFFHAWGKEGEAVRAEFQTALAGADSRLIAAANANPAYKGMGTTLTMAYSLDHELHVVHVGDSRCYLCRGGAMARITQDHTLVQEMVNRGVLQPEEAAHHHLRHVISNAIGGNEPGVKVDVHRLHLESGDLLLLCSDGLTEMVPEPDVHAILRSEPDVRKACERLVAEANNRGGKDNITVVLARYD
jgi:protein phosphatase